MAKYWLSIDKLTPKQVLNLKSSLIDINNKYNVFLPAFAPLNKEFSLGNHLCDNFPDCFFFYPYSHNTKN